MYELIDINGNQYYVGQTSVVSARGSQHIIDGKIKQYLQITDIDSSLNILEQQFFSKSDSGVAKQWLDDR